MSSVVLSCAHVINYNSSLNLCSHNGLSAEALKILKQERSSITKVLL